ncbi:MAG: hypothetical protein ACNYVW_00485 [Methanosarcinales archaeon]
MIDISKSTKRIKKQKELDERVDKAIGRLILDQVDLNEKVRKLKKEVRKLNKEVKKLKLAKVIDITGQKR